MVANLQDRLRERVPAPPNTFSGIPLVEIAELAHNVVNATKLALREDSKATPWLNLSPAMQGLLLRCVEAIYANPNMPVAALMNGFYRNQALIQHAEPPAKRSDLNQFPKIQQVIWSQFHATVKCAIHGPAK